MELNKFQPSVQRFTDILLDIILQIVKIQKYC